MTRDFRVYCSTLTLALALISCSGSKASQGDAASVAPGATPDAAPALADPRVATADTARIQGNPEAKVWLVMASDFQCPACKYWHDTYSAEIMRDYVATGKVRFAYTNYPIDQLHPNARAAAEAAMCSAAQGKFWGMHDLLFARQAEWAPLPDPVAQFRQIALKAGVDTAVWNQCLTDDVMAPVVDADKTRAQAGGVDQTPYFFVGAQKIGGAVPAANLRKMLDAALAQAGGATR